MVKKTLTYTDANGEEVAAKEAKPEPAAAPKAAPAPKAEPAKPAEAPKAAPAVQGVLPVPAVWRDFRPPRF